MAPAEYNSAIPGAAVRQPDDETPISSGPAPARRCRRRHHGLRCRRHPRPPVGHAVGPVDLGHDGGEAGGIEAGQRLLIDVQRADEQGEFADLLLQPVQAAGPSHPQHRMLVYASAQALVDRFDPFQGLAGDRIAAHRCAAWTSAAASRPMLAGSSTVQLKPMVNSRSARHSAWGQAIFR
ncbi:MAG: hypothetical protein RLZZ127_335 [Planctomycetota bacterium]